MTIKNEIVAPRVRDLAELRTQLSRWLAERLPHAHDIDIAGLRYPSGAGMSHETILFEAQWLERGERHSRELVVRVKPVANMVFPDDLFDKQYRIMQWMYETKWAPVAEPLWFEESDAVIGAPFFVMQQMHGRIPVSRPPYAEVGWVAEATPEQRRRLWESGVRQMATIAKVPVDAVQFLAGPEGARSGLDQGSGLNQEWNRYVRFVEWISRERRFPILDAALIRLKERWPRNQPAGMMWGAAELVNMMFADDFTVLAVMDWEQPSLGGPLNDLAWWLFMADIKHGPASGRRPLEGLGSREETIALWEETSGLSAQDIEWYEDFMALKVGCMANRVSAIHGMPAPDHAALARRLGLSVTG